MNPTPAQRLIVFTRYPEPGRAKTRLIPTLGADGAAELHRRLTVHTLATASTLRHAASEVDVAVYFAGGTRPLMEGLYGPDWAYEDQGAGALGVRMARAMRAAFDTGRTRVVVIGTDCPELTAPLLRNAFDALGSAHVVLGPASDGGYYLIGLRRMIPALFDDIPWGTSEVLQQTLAQARRLNLEVRLLPVLRDVDRPEDLTLCEHLDTSSLGPNPADPRR